MKSKVDKWRKNGEIVKRPEGFFVPKEYNHWRDTGEEREERYMMDVHSVPPKISYNDKIGKWQLWFVGARMPRGTGLQDFVYYFDSIRDILVFLRTDRV